MTESVNTPPPLTVPDWPVTDDAVRQVMTDMLADGSWGRYHGPHCDLLRQDLATFHQADHVHLCSSGTAAVELALRGTGIQPGEEVILAGYDFKANYINVLMLGAIPVLIDTMPQSPVINPQRIADAVTSRTRAVVCSHLHGNMADMDAVVEIAHQHSLHVIEDACQVPGALLNGERAGMLGDVGTLSFGGSKLLTAGRGGAVVTNRPEIAQRVRLYTQRGNDAYPLSEMQAAILRPQLARLDASNERRAENVVRLCDVLQQSDTAARLEPVIWTADARNARAVFYKLALLATNAATRADVEQLSAAARLRGIPLDPAFSALHRIHSQRRMRISGELTNTDKWHHQLMILHHPVLLSSADNIQRLGQMLAALVK